MQPVFTVLRLQAPCKPGYLPAPAPPRRRGRFYFNAHEAVRWLTATVSLDRSDLHADRVGDHEYR